MTPKGMKKNGVPELPLQIPPISVIDERIRVLRDEGASLKRLRRAAKAVIDAQQKQADQEKVKPIDMQSR